MSAAPSRVAADYLSRVNYAGPTDATLTTLRGLVSAHTRCIAFENLDSLLGRPVADLGPEALVDKLVRRRRGGFCYEQNGLMAYVLDELGFSVKHLSARVMLNGTVGPLAAENHDALLVTVPSVEGRFLVDVGFGGPTPTAPLRITAGIVQQTPHGAYKLLDHRGGYLLQVQVGEEWKPLYTFTTHPRPRIDMEVGSWYMSTHPTSLFVTALTASIVTDDERYNLRGRNLTVHRSDATQRLRLEGVAEVLDLLSSRFGVSLDDFGDRSLLQARVSEVLDA
ncbi:arylamine N-acetyltransferase [Mycobacterium sp. ACS1612]|uniref:arylamine N-acetyltransferase family protein n=1 Tax=Mycobacterium sp. ACS1612 TaxID=1834117 RepID=UPI0007FD0001|nr:arylamine N-acetyltransferase [Mycobacterium sp. ACS1612]OBF33671.1 arylamine N-acetyltransferase [Mycobacterium sp. ACS1612]